MALHSDGAAASITRGDLHLVLHLAPDGQRWGLETHGHHDVELFDLVRDPRCERNVADQRVADARELRAELVAWLREESATSATSAADAATLELLEQLGYATGSEPAGALWVDDDCETCRRYAPPGTATSTGGDR